MGPIRQLFEKGDIKGCRAHLQSLWALRHSNDVFTASDAGDAAWLFDRTQGDTALQQQLWPKLLGLLSRWALLVSRSAPSNSAGWSTGAVAFLRALQRWLAALLPTSPVPWAVRAPALLLIAVVGITTPEAAGAAASPQQPPTGPSPLILASEVLRSQLRRRRPSADLLLDATDAVADLCTAVELVSERHAAKGDWGVLSALLAALLATLGGALSDLFSGLAASAAVATSSTPQPSPSPPSQPLPPPLPPLGKPRLALAVAAAAAQEAAAAALAALHASCRQIGSACARAAAAAAATDTPSLPGTPRDTNTAVKTGLLTAGAGAGVAAPAGLTAVAQHLRDTSAAAAEAAVASIVAAPMGLTTDPWAVLSVTAAAASGLVEGYTLTVRLQPLGRPQDSLLQLLHPSWALLSDTIKGAAAAAATAASAASGIAATGIRPEPGCGSPCAMDADPRVIALDMALGYGWSRLRSLSPLPKALQAAVDSVVGEMAAAAAATPALAAGPAADGESAALTGPTGPAAGRGGGRFWHPARGALAMLLLGSLGVGRVLQLAVKGVTPDDGAAEEVMEGHRQSPVFSDTQLLAKTVVEALRPKAAAAAAAAAAAVALEGRGSRAAAARTALAGAILDDAAAAARRLHVLYGGVADTAAGRAWLAALPPAATGALRELLDRVFVCQVSVLATAYDVLEVAAAPPPLPPLHTSPPAPPLRVAAPTGSNASSSTGFTGGADQTPHADGRAAVAAAAAARAMAALADLQFCALELRVHGELVSRLNAAAAAAPAAALPPLLAQLPCYPAFAAAYADGSGGGGFASAPVAASRLAFLLPLASSYVPSAADPAEAAYVVLPYIYLLLKGAPEAVIQAAHSTWAALLAGLGLGEEQEGDGGGGYDGGGGEPARAGGPQRRRRHAEVALAASMVPYYLDRTFQEPCSVSDVEMSEWGLRQVLQSLPDSHPVKAWTAVRLTRQLVDWAAPSGRPPAMQRPAERAAGGRGAASGGGSGQPGPHGHDGRRVDGVAVRVGLEDSAGSGTETARPEEADVSSDPSDERAAAGSAELGQHRLRRLALAVGGFVALVDFPLLPQALRALGVGLRDLGPERAGARQVVLQQLHDCWLACSDYARKQLLEQWFRSTLGDLGIRAKL